MLPGNYRLGFFLFVPETQASQQRELARRSQSPQPGPSRNRLAEPDDTALPDVPNTTQGYSSIGQPSLPLSTGLHQEVGINQQDVNTAFSEWFATSSNVPPLDFEEIPHQDRSAAVQSLPSTETEPYRSQEIDLHEAFVPKDTLVGSVCTACGQTLPGFERNGAQDNSNTVQGCSTVPVANTSWYGSVSHVARQTVDVGTMTEDWAGTQRTNFERSALTPQALTGDTGDPSSHDDIQECTAPSAPGFVIESEAPNPDYQVYVWAPPEEQNDETVDYNRQSLLLEDSLFVPSNASPRGIVYNDVSTMANMGNVAGNWADPQRVESDYSELNLPVWVGNMGDPSQTVQDCTAPNALGFVPESGTLATSLSNIAYTSSGYEYPERQAVENTGELWASAHQNHSHAAQGSSFIAPISASNGFDARPIANTGTVSDDWVGPSHAESQVDHGLVSHYDRSGQAPQMEIDNMGNPRVYGVQENFVPSALGLVTENGVPMASSSNTGFSASNHDLLEEQIPECHTRDYLRSLRSPRPRLRVFPSSHSTPYHSTPSLINSNDQSPMRLPTDSYPATPYSSTFTNTGGSGQPGSSFMWPVSSSAPCDRTSFPIHAPRSTPHYNSQLPVVDPYTLTRRRSVSGVGSQNFQQSPAHRRMESESQATAQMAETRPGYPDLRPHFQLAEPTLPPLNMGANFNLTAPPEPETAPPALPSEMMEFNSDSYAFLRGRFP